VLKFSDYNPAIVSSLFGASSGLSGIIFGRLNDALVKLILVFINISH
jgi:hypothetical protein